MFHPHTWDTFATSFRSHEDIFEINFMGLILPCQHFGITKELGNITISRYFAYPRFSQDYIKMFIFCKHAHYIHTIFQYSDTFNFLSLYKITPRRCQTDEQWVWPRLLMQTLPKKRHIFFNDWWEKDIRPRKKGNFLTGCARLALRTICVLRIQAVDTFSDKLDEKYPVTQFLSIASFLPSLGFWK